MFLNHYFSMLVLQSKDEPDQRKNVYYRVTGIFFFCQEDTEVSTSTLQNRKNIGEFQSVRSFCKSWLSTSN